MTNEKQVAINALWEKYAKMLEMNISLLDELEKKPKEVEVIKEVIVEKKIPIEKEVIKEVIVEKEVLVEVPIEKEVIKEVIVEVEADVDLTTPQAVADLERKVQDKLSKHERHGD